MILRLSLNVRKYNRYMKIVDVPYSEFRLIDMWVFSYSALSYIYILHKYQIYYIQFLLLNIIIIIC